MNENITKGANPIKVAKLVKKIIHLKNPRKKYIFWFISRKIWNNIKVCFASKIFEYLGVKTFLIFY